MNNLLQRLGQWRPSLKTTWLCFVFLLFLSSCSPDGKQAIIGVWQQKENAFWDFIEFRADGTFLHHDAFGTHAMKYRWSGNDRMKFEFERFSTNDTTVVETLVYGVVPKARRLELADLNPWGNGEIHHYQRLSHAEAAKLDLSDFKGSELVALPETASVEQIIAALFKNVNPDSGSATNYEIGKILRVVTSRGSPFFVEVNTNRGQKGVYLEFDRPQIGVETLRGWWCRTEELPASSKDSL